MNKAAEQAEKMAEKAAKDFGSLGEKAKERAEKAAELAKDAADKAAEKASRTTSKVSDSKSASRFSDLTKKMSEKMFGVGKEASDRAKTTLKDTSSDIGEKVSKARSQASESKIGAEARKRFDDLNSSSTFRAVKKAVDDAKLLEGWGDAARELLGSPKKKRVVKVASPPSENAYSSTTDGENEKEEDDDRQDYDGPDALMAVKEERTGWERFAERLSQTPIIEDILKGSKKARRVVGRSKVGKAAGEAKTAVDDIREELREKWETSQNPWVYRISAAYDAAFSETEESQCIAEVQRLDPSFSVHDWLDELKDDTFPKLIKSYLHMDDDALKRDLSEGAFAQVSAAMKQRKSEVRLFSCRRRRRSYSSRSPVIIHICVRIKYVIDITQR